MHSFARWRHISTGSKKVLSKIPILAQQHDSTQPASGNPLERSLLVSTASVSHGNAKDHAEPQSCRNPNKGKAFLAKLNVACCNRLVFAEWQQHKGRVPGRKRVGEVYAHFQSERSDFGNVDSFGVFESLGRPCKYLNMSKGQQVLRDMNSYNSLTVAS